MVRVHRIQILFFAIVLCSRAWVGFSAELPASAKDAPVFNISLLTDNTPDFTDIDSYLRSITSQYETPREKALALFRWGQRLRKQKSLPFEDGHEVLDPIFFYNNYGYTMCAIASGLNNALWLNLGWKARYVQLGDHTVSECSWDGGATWHMFDNSTSFYCFNDKGEIASVREIEQNPRFYLENFSPECGTNPVKGLKDHQGWRFGSDHPVENQRTLANGVDSFLPPNDLHEDHLVARWGRRYVLNLRPGEQYTRYFRNLDTPTPDPRYYRPLNGKDVEGKTDKSIRANGVWRYEPNLRDPATREQVYSDAGVTWAANGITGTGHVIFKVSAANVITSAKVSANGSGVSFSVSRTAGIQWEALSGTDAAIELLEHVAGGTEFLLKAELKDPNAVLTHLAIETVTQISRAAFPRLTRGPNTIQFRTGAQADTITLAPSLVGGQHAKTVFEEKSVGVNSKPYYNVATLGPAKSGEPASATWKIDAPTLIVGAYYGASVCAKDNGDVSLLHSWDGKTFAADFAQTGKLQPYDTMINRGLQNVPADTRQAFFRYQFSSSADPEKKWVLPGIQTAHMTILHEPRVRGYTPVEVTFCWMEYHADGERERRHTQVVKSPHANYTIRAGGFRDPRMKWIRMNLRGHGPVGEATTVGYSDGREETVAQQPPRALYHWGKNVALGKPYTLEGKQSDKNPDGGGDLTDGVIMPPDTYTSAKWMPTNVLFAQDVSPVATLDLGAVRTIAALRISSGQAADFRMTYPDEFMVEASQDGKTFATAGRAEFNQVFDQPADYLPGECEESTLFDALPAGGRLAYAYRVILDRPVEARFVRVTSKCRKGWGVLLSEIQVFDAVKIDATIPPSVVLPPLPKGNP